VADTQDTATRLPSLSGSEESSPSPSEPSDNEQRSVVATQGGKVSCLFLRSPLKKQILQGSLPTARVAPEPDGMQVPQEDKMRCFRGVTLSGSNGDTKWWTAQLHKHRRKIRVGYSYATEEAAARAYDRACIAINGRGIRTNFPLTAYPEEVRRHGLAARWTQVSLDQRFDTGVPEMVSHG